jgi:hypothetical protein
MATTLKSEILKVKEISMVLNKLKELPEEDLVGVLVPIRQPDDNRIILKLARECNFCKDDDG